jgi:hypothetical protein
MAVERRHPFSLEGNFVIARRMTLNGRDCQPGEPLNRSGLTDRQIRAWWEQRRVEAVDPAAARAPPPAKAAQPSRPAPTPPPPPPPIIPLPPPPPPPLPPTPAPPAAAKPGPAIESAKKPVPNGQIVKWFNGFTRWHVMGPAGEDISGPHSKTEAEAIVARLTREAADAGR